MLAIVHRSGMDNHKRDGTAREQIGVGRESESGTKGIQNQGKSGGVG